MLAYLSALISYMSIVCLLMITICCYSSIHIHWNVILKAFMVNQHMKELTFNTDKCVNHIRN
jgi:hypothetical protein